MWMNTLRTHGAMVWVWGVRKWTFRTTTVTQILKWKISWKIHCKKINYASHLLKNYKQAYISSFNNILANPAMALSHDPFGFCTRNSKTKTDPWRKNFALQKMSRWVPLYCIVIFPGSARARLASINIKYTMFNSNVYVIYTIDILK